MTLQMIALIASLIGSLGFPIVVASYLVWKLGKVTDALVKKLDSIENAIRDTKN